MPIVFVTNYLTPYQAALFSRSSDVIITYSPLDSGRQWSPQRAEARVKDVSRLGVRNRLNEISRECNGPAISFLIGGSTRSPEFWFSIAVCRLRRTPFAIWLERPRGPVSLIRRSVLRLALGKAGMILGVGTIATVSYRQLIRGIKVSNFPYSYGRRTPIGAERSVKSGPDPKMTAFFICGAEWPRKGLDILLTATASMPRELQARLELRVAGLSELPVELQGVTGMTPAANVSYLGYLQPDEVRRELACADVLVVASRYDGWAVVVEEAMAEGTPVIASDAVGAAVDLVVDGYSGYRFAAGDSRALAVALTAMMNPDTCDRPLSAGALAVVIRHRDTYNVESLERAIRGSAGREEIPESST
jgi:glycosyltransferase involved in cell wall biosynthesis